MNMHFPRAKIYNKQERSKKFPQCDNYQLNFHGNMLIHYKFEYTVMRN